ncbi:DUF4232 domain-containing protein [Actinoplanes sp. L3-i22]|uniref:DUF4232 domain-containing protein n=1 Tax=Actinoplanes sp. L3-i22 TaxID=2836373 RepID=UPI001C7917A9|nr:DUF4232 domain-containing protein [Actinoplanes sp. L3-i22]BCY10132.1 hypothetical protein L3i22_052200 [Actinoplanes sp. L3-i22]
MKRTTILLMMATPLLFAAGCSANSPTAASPTSSAPAKTQSPTTSPAEPTTGETTTSPATGSGGGKPASTRCHTTDLKLTVGEGDGAAGTAYQPLIFTNTSDHTCTMYGYPGVSWVTGENGSQVNDPFARSDQRKKETVTLKPGATANAVLQSTNPGFFDKDKCKPVSVRGLRVYPPDETASIFLSLPGEACSIKGVGVGKIWAIAAGTKI